MEKQSYETREKKRSQFSDPAKPKNKTTLVLIVILVALVAVAAYMVMSGSGDSTSATAVTATNNDSGAHAAGEIRIPLADLDGGQARFFDYTLSNNTPVRFFAIKSKDGVYRAALDACDVCYHAKKGYYQDGDDMICKNCGLKFPTNQINDVAGGCNPVGLTRTIENGNLVIKASELESRAGYYF
ncbi:MAG: DUF2318 domain-containing protein [Blastocatellia bacterium]|nr:DUF2318 domain-containing protein [Blastocatellia bacterium]